MKTGLSDRLSATNPTPDDIRVRANDRLWNQSGTLHGSGGSPVPQDAQGGLMAGHDRSVVQSPAIAELTQRQAGRATKQEHETDHHPILAHPPLPDGPTIGSTSG